MVTSFLYYYSGGRLGCFHKAQHFYQYWGCRCASLYWASQSLSKFLTEDYNPHHDSYDVGAAAAFRSRLLPHSYARVIRTLSMS